MKKPAPELILHVDGGARGNPGPAAAGIVLREASGRTLLEAGYRLGRMTNNQAEYSALLLGLQAAQRYGAHKLAIYSDSELMVRQVLGRYRVKSPDLKPLYEQVRAKLGTLATWQIHHVPRERNARADALLNQTLDADRDVIGTQLIAPEPNPADNPPASDATTTSLPAPVEVQVLRAGPGEPCTAACAAGAKFTIEDALPAAMGLDVAGKLIAAVHELRDDSHDRTEQSATREFTCARCGTLFRVSLAGRFNP